MIRLKPIVFRALLSMHASARGTRSGATLLAVCDTRVRFIPRFPPHLAACAPSDTPAARLRIRRVGVRISPGAPWLVRVPLLTTTLWA